MGGALLLSSCWKHYSVLLHMEDQKFSKNSKELLEQYLSGIKVRHNLQSFWFQNFVTWISYYIQQHCNNYGILLCPYLNLLHMFKFSDPFLSKSKQILCHCHLHFYFLPFVKKIEMCSNI